MTHLPLTRQQYRDLKDPKLNKLWGIITLIKEKQDSLIDFIDFTPGRLVTNDVRIWLQSTPYNYTVTFTQQGQNSLITRIEWS
jgi:hypothetical protein